ncbi:MAG: hypothetical protein KA444_02040 [Bacteroidia bacterium]|nr:hypothetical protein [Bacteroidia bacterium]
MNSNENSTEMFNTKSKLSALWLFAMLTYTYGDVVTLMDPIKHGDFELTEGFLLGGSIYMMIPISMVLLSRLLKYKANRLMSIIAGSIMTITLIMTLFVAVPTTYYVFFTTIEVVTTAFIVRYACKWRNDESSILKTASITA